MKLSAAALGMFLLLCGTVMGQQQQTPDEKTLAQLRAAGSDLSKPHEIDHWLYFKSKSDAEAAARDLLAKGFIVQSVAKSKKEWRVLAHHRMVPDSQAIGATTRLLESVAAAHSGEYDGWETQVVE